MCSIQAIFATPSCKDFSPVFSFRSFKFSIHLPYKIRIEVHFSHMILSFSSPISWKNYLLSIGLLVLYDLFFFFNYTGKYGKIHIKLLTFIAFKEVGLRGSEGTLIYFHYTFLLWLLNFYISEEKKGNKNNTELEGVSAKESKIIPVLQKWGEGPGGENGTGLRRWERQELLWRQGPWAW